VKKVLIITYYWPPSGGAGVQRMLKLVKYIRESGWEPIVFTADDADYPVHDNSLENDIPNGVTIWKNKIWEPYDLYKKFIGVKKNQKVYSGFMSEKKKISTTQKLSIWIRGNLFIPDARMFWIKPSIKYLSNKLNHEKIDAVISSGPPHSCHMIALGIKKKFNLPWLADFRDPWTNIDFYDQLGLTSFADLKHKRLEKEVLKNADAIDTVSWNWASDFEKICGKKINVITNGFDEEDFIIPESSIARTNEFIISHIGSMNRDRNHPLFWKAIKELIDRDSLFESKIRIQLIGKNDASVEEQIEINQLEKYIKRIEYLPHNEINRYQLDSSILYLPLNNTPNVEGIIPGKLFEYLASRKPILLIGSITGDSSRIIKEANAGYTIDFNDFEGIKKSIKKVYDEWNNESNYSTNNIDIQKFSRREIAKKFASVLDSLIR
jgi:glycosyltransferase involved in cell wall biosynthesis